MKPALLLLLLSCAIESALAQGGTTNPFVMNTGSGQTLLSEVRQLMVDSNTVQPSFQVQFGFRTEETPQPGRLFDSFTITLQTANQQFTAVYATLDANGP